MIGWWAAAVNAAFWGEAPKMPPSAIRRPALLELQYFREERQDLVAQSLGDGISLIHSGFWQEDHEFLTPVHSGRQATLLP